AFECLTRRVADCMDQAVEAVPLLAELLEYAFDLSVFSDVTGQDDIAAELGGKLFYPFFEAVTDIGEREFSTFPVACLGDTVGDRPVGDQPGDQYALAL